MFHDNVPEESPVVCAERAVHVVRQQVINCMPADSWSETQDFVGDRANLDADIVLLHLLHDIWMPSQCEAVADTF